MSKTILITGSTDGIGKLAAISLAKLGHTIYIHGRNKDKVDKTISEVSTLSKNDKIYGVVSDFSDLESVKNMASKINSELTSLDVLVNNAGVFKSPDTSNINGIDTRLVVNYLAPYLLTEQLLPLLEKNDYSRLVNLSSAAQSPVDLEALLGNKSLSQQDSYAQSKLALTMWSFYLAQKLNNVNVIAVNPGSLLNTKMANEAYGQYWSSADKGANIIHELVDFDKYNNSSGKYYDNDNGGFLNAHDDTYNKEKITQLITTTELALNKIFKTP